MPHPLPAAHPARVLHFVSFLRNVLSGRVGPAVAPTAPLPPLPDPADPPPRETWRNPLPAWNGVPYVQQQRLSAQTLRSGVDLNNVKPAVRDLLRRLGEAGIVDSFEITSGYRDPGANAAAKGAKGSRHLSGDAADVSTKGWTDEQRGKFLAAAIQNGARGIGIYPNGSFHFDLRETPAAWGPAGYSSSAPEAFPAWAQQHVRGLVGAPPAQVANAPPRTAASPAREAGAPLPPQRPADPAQVATPEAQPPPMDPPSFADSLFSFAPRMAAQTFPAVKPQQSQPVANVFLPEGRLPGRKPFDAQALFANLRAPLTGLVA